MVKVKMLTLPYFDTCTLAQTEEVLQSLYLQCSWPDDAECNNPKKPCVVVLPGLVHPPLKSMQVPIQMS